MSNKLRTYKLFKENFQLEYYLTAVATVRYRIALTRIRVSYYRLAIETGRYQKPTSLPINQRLCTLCIYSSRRRNISDMHMWTQCSSQNGFFLALCKVYTLYFSSCYIPKEKVIIIIYYAK